MVRYGRKKERRRVSECAREEGGREEGSENTEAYVYSVCSFCRLYLNTVERFAYLVQLRLDCTCNLLVGLAHKHWVDDVIKYMWIRL